MAISYGKSGEKDISYSDQPGRRERGRHRKDMLHFARSFNLGGTYYRGFRYQPIQLGAEMLKKQAAPSIQKHMVGRILPTRVPHYQ